VTPLAGPVDRAARRLSNAAATRAACAPVRDLLGAEDVGVGYQVQELLVAERLRAGQTRVGRKIGLTNPKVQHQLGVDQPDFGVLLDAMAWPQNQPVDLDRLLQPKIEAEIAFVLKADLDHEGVTEADVLAATDHVLAALEIVDSRVADWDISIVDTVADNASCGLFVLGSEPVAPASLDLAAVSMTLRQDGELVSSGTGADCLGNPVTAVAWLANTARAYGAPLRAGEVVLSGALGPMVPVRPGARYDAELVGIGSVGVAFSAAPAPP
jgi:2-keto-4-pentenoate hydratase